MSQSSQAASFLTSAGSAQVIAGRIGTAVAALLNPLAEVVLHDLSKDCVIAIWNARSDRRVGDPSLLDILASEPNDLGLIGPYQRADGSGQRVKSVSVIIPSADGIPEMLMCINISVGAIDQVRNLLELLCSTPKPMPESLFRRDWREQANLAISDFVHKINKQLGALTKKERAELVGELDALGLFEVRHATEHIAAQIGVSRAMLYRLRKHGASKTTSRELSI